MNSSTRKILLVLLAFCFSSLAALADVRFEDHAQYIPATYNYPGYYLIDNLDYGDASWVESEELGISLKQDMDIYYPANASSSETLFPLVIYTHPNGSTKEAGVDLLTKVFVPLLENGYAIASVEFRHPLANFTGFNEDGGFYPDEPFNNDLIQAGRFLLRADNGELLKIDSNQAFSLSRSRGSLAIYSTLRANSKKIKGLMSYNSQVTYHVDELVERFVGNDELEAHLRAEKPNDERFGSALQEVKDSVNTPPICFRYKDELRTLPIVDNTNLDFTHLPNFGEALCEEYSNKVINDDGATAERRCMLATALKSKAPEFNFKFAAEYFNALRDKNLNKARSFCNGEEFQSALDASL